MFNCVLVCLQLRRDSTAAKNKDIEIFAIGITNDVDKANLDTIASTPIDRHVFQVGYIHSLNQYTIIIHDIHGKQRMLIDVTLQRQKEI